MTWLTATGQLATQLRALVTTPQQLGPGDVGAPAVAYVAVIELVQRVHAELTDTAGHDTHRRPDADDVQMWRQRFDSLAGGSVPAELRQLATARIDDVPGSAAGKVWRTSARTARLAEAEWEVSTRDSRPTGRGADAALADLASLQWAAATAFLNATQALDTIAPAPAPTVDAASTHARRAAKTSKHAIHGLVTGRDDLSHADLQEHQPPVPIDPAGEENLARAMKRLSHLIMSAHTMGPRIVEQIVAMHRITTTHLGDAVTRTARDRQHRRLGQVGDAVRHHARALEIGPPDVETLRTLDPVDDIQIAALRQATVIARAAEEAATATPIPIGHLLSSVAQVPDVTTRAAARARSSIIGGEWLRPAEGDVTASPRRARDWQPTTAFDEIPMETALAHAATGAMHLRRELPRATPKTATDVLTGITTRPHRLAVINPEHGSSL